MYKSKQNGSFVLIFRCTDRMCMKLQDFKLIGRKPEFASLLHSEGCVQIVWDLWWAEWHWIRLFYKQFCLESHTLWTLSIMLHWMLKINCGVMVEVLKVSCFKFGILSWEFCKIALLLFSPVSISFVLLHLSSCACIVGHLRLQYQFIHSRPSLLTQS